MTFPSAYCPAYFRWLTQVSRLHNKASNIQTNLPHSERHQNRGGRRTLQLLNLIIVPHLRLPPLTLVTPLSVNSSVNTHYSQGAPSQHRIQLNSYFAIILIILQNGLQFDVDKPYLFYDELEYMTVEVSHHTHNLDFGNWSYSYTQLCGPDQIKKCCLM